MDIIVAIILFLSVLLLCEIIEVRIELKKIRKMRKEAEEIRKLK